MTDATHPSDRPLAIDDAELCTLRAIVEGTAHATGDDFFRSLVRNLSKATGIPNAFVAEFAESKARVRALAFWTDGQFLADQAWDLDGTPCEDVLRGNLCHHPTGVAARFPKEAGVESYLGVPLLGCGSDVMGHLALFDTRPMPHEPRLLYTFQIFAARAAAELGRLRAEQRLRDSEERFRDLFDEAPIAYVHEDLQSRFIRANRSAQRILGITPEDVPNTLGMSLVPNTPSAQQRVKDAFASIGQGADTSGVVLELCRKDTGAPIWIQWWSRPDPSGNYTRTMFLDITEHVLMEREQARLREQNLYLREEIQSVHNFKEIVGQSPALRSVLASVSRVAPTDATVLIQGETGTGKELIARAIHSSSQRGERPLIKVNCAALPANLVESELFGHEKGAFTGALNRRIGRFELADGGTLFLDEVGEIPLDVQVKLLRVLQEKEFERVGGSTPIRANVRLIAATNRDLMKEVAEKRFREDLFYRLNVFPIQPPPLRNRTEDIPLLVDYLIDKFAMRIGKPIKGIEPASLVRLQHYRWPGNVRELENVIERAVILTDGPLLEIDPEMLPRLAEDHSPATASPSVHENTLEAIEKAHIEATLRQTRGIIEGPNGAAQILGLHPSTLRYRMKKLGVLSNRGD